MIAGCESRYIEIRDLDGADVNENKCNPTERFGFWLNKEPGEYIYDVRQIVPSDILPNDVYDKTANNNLDVILFDCKLFLAFRTAPSHFASSETEMYIVSTDDFKKFNLERRISIKKDLREPRFLIANGTLFMYFAVLGTNPVKFEPEGTMVIQRDRDGKWSRPQWLFRNTFIPWRGKEFDDTPTLIGYTGGDNIYSEPTDAIKVFWLRTNDGINFEPFLSKKEIILQGGVSETDIVKHRENEYVAVSRNELGDESGWGSKICRINGTAPYETVCKSDPKKYDSPLLFKHKERIILIGRRNLTETGNYDLNMRDLSFVEQRNKYEIEYSFAPKRCSVWEVDPENLSVNFILDLPSRGDTCFASHIPLGENDYLIFNYSSPIDGPDYKWIEGQANPTYIYSLILHLK